MENYTEITCMTFTQYYKAMCESFDCKCNKRSCFMPVFYEKKRWVCENLLENKCKEIERY